MCVQPQNIRPEEQQADHTARLVHTPEFPGGVVRNRQPTDNLA